MDHSHGAGHQPPRPFICLDGSSYSGQPLLISICVAIEQLGYGFGFTAYMLYLIYIADGEHKTAHYAIGTGFMALGMMLPGMPAGWIQEHLGYTNFFIWVCVCTIPGILASWMIRNRLDSSFGKKR